MKYFSLTFLLITLLVSASFASGQTPANNSDATTQAIMQLENSLNDAVLKGDSAALAKLLADEWFVRLGDANVITKSQYVDWLKSNGGPYSSIKDHDVNISVHDSAVVVSGISTRGLSGSDAVRELRFTRVYAKSAAGWQLVAMHFDRLNQH
jgi:hypothetical protein